MKITTALVSVADKSKIVDFCHFLVKNNVSLLATGGTYKILKENSIVVEEVSDYTQSPEILDGRVKTLHPKIHGGILARGKQDEITLSKHNIRPINLVIANLYPFEKTIAQINCSLQDAIENIDIGGVALLRAAAKNHQHCLLVSNPNDYAEIIKCIFENKVDKKIRYNYAIKAFSLTSNYDYAISCYLATNSTSRHENESIPNKLKISLRLKSKLRYGENPHQVAGVYVSEDKINQSITDGSIVNAQQLAGKELSYNNIMDAEAAWECVNQFTDTACVIVKHTNPCGVAICNSPLDAYYKAFQSDPISSFGSVIAFNKPIDGAEIQSILDNQFVEAVIAPSFTENKGILPTDKNVRLLRTGVNINSKNIEIKSIKNGFLIQETDNKSVVEENCQVVSNKQPSQNEIIDSLFAWKIAKCVKSNAIVLVKNQQTLAIGTGQTSRIDSLKTALAKAQEFDLNLNGATMASDAFFPFADCVNLAKQHGISCTIQPGGSKNDQEVIDCVNLNNQSMLYTLIRHFKH